ncbi:hypothetical protein H4R35_004744 [Dimargaris xerosporica]|nr:hypothetical protein H4R35_004744 [Dimargaris xerosporica]
MVGVKLPTLAISLIAALALTTHPAESASIPKPQLGFSTSRIPQSDPISDTGARSFGYSGPKLSQKQKIVPKVNGTDSKAHIRPSTDVTIQLLPVNSTITTTTTRTTTTSTTRTTSTTTTFLATVPTDTPRPPTRGTNSKARPKPTTIAANKPWRVKPTTTTAAPLLPKVPTDASRPSSGTDFKTHTKATTKPLRVKPATPAAAIYFPKVSTAVFRPRPLQQPTVISAYANIHRTEYANIHGFVSFVPSPTKKATFIKIALSGLAPNARYKVHIHRNMVSNSDDRYWDCSETEGHFDPLDIRADNERAYQCDPSRPMETCELGDISGKFGDVVATKYGSYIRLIDTPDPYLKLTGDFGVLQRSVVIHDKDGQRVACGNISPLGYA